MSVKRPNEEGAMAALLRQSIASGRDIIDKRLIRPPRPTAQLPVRLRPMGKKK